MQNDHPETDNDLPQEGSENIFSDDSDRTVIAGPPVVPPSAADDDIWGAPSTPPSDAPEPPADDDRTRVMEPLPTGATPEPKPAEVPEAPPAAAMPTVESLEDIADEDEASASPFDTPAPVEDAAVSTPPELSVPPAAAPELATPPEAAGLSMAPTGEDLPPDESVVAPPVVEGDAAGLSMAPSGEDLPEDATLIAVPGEESAEPEQAVDEEPEDATPDEPEAPVSLPPADADVDDEIFGSDDPAEEVAAPIEEAPELAEEQPAELAAPPVADAEPAEDLGIAEPPTPEPADDTDILSPPEDILEEGDGDIIEDPRIQSVQDGPVPMGTMINNNYEIKELISAGGMGEVFRGENAFTGDAVAIKIVLQSLADDPKIAALFMREAKVLCGLSDQAIVRYYNFVKDAELDRFCLIMEFISGQSLSDHVRDVAPLTEDEARGLMRRVASGLEKAHQMEVVHRDLSPDNVMLRDGKVSDAVLIDFGIAKSTEMAEQTLHGQLAGKFKYISPEQLGHFGGEIGPRTDIYGLGLLMAAGLRGEPLDMGSSVVEAVNARREIPDLSDIPESFRPLLAHMLEPDPAHRPARMSDVIRLIDQPEDIPEKYGGVRPIATEATQPPGGLPGLSQPGMIATPGLQAPPTHSGQTLGGASFVPPGDASSASPFGGQTAAPQTFVPGLTQPPGQQTMSGGSARRRRDEGGGIFRWIIALALIGGVGGYVAYRQGLLPVGEQVAGTETAIPDEVTSTPAGPMTRAGFLSTYDAGECSFAARIAGGRDAGTIETFSAESGVFASLADDFETAFDTRPTIRERTVPETHCAALAMAKSLQASPGTAPVLTLDSDEMQSGGSIVGRLSDRRGRPIWLVLITAAGGVYNLTDRMTEQADGSATFSFGLNADGSGLAQPQLIMAVASDQPLIAAAAANNGARASDLLPLIEAEIGGRDGEAGAALGYFELLP